MQLLKQLKMSRLGGWPCLPCLTPTASLEGSGSYSFTLSANPLCIFWILKETWNGAERHLSARINAHCICLSTCTAVIFWFRGPHFNLHLNLEKMKLRGDLLGLYKYLK